MSSPREDTAANPSFGRNERIRIAFVSTSRSDFSTMEPVLRGALADARFDAQLVVCGQHLRANTPLPEELAGVPAVRLSGSTDSVDWISQIALCSFLRAQAMDVVFLVGDRFELLSAAECCTVSGVSIAHCSGGERTFGAFDDQVRDAVTKLAHMHLVAHAEAADRVRSLQEESWRIAVTGDPGLDAIRHEKRLSAQELEGRLGVLPAKTDIVVALHPVTRALDEAGLWLNAIAEFSRDFEGRIFLSAPNGDSGSEAINSAWDSLLETGRRMVLPSLGGRIFRGLVAACGALVGNSSAGVWEVPSLGVPSLDLGTRQSGRIRGDTVWHCEVADAVELGANIRHLLTPEIQSACRTGQNPYGDGDATPRILDHIARSARNPRLMAKP